MRLIAILSWILLFPAPSPAHPLHLSITNITYENGMLNIEMKSFRDDWEVGYFHYHSKPIDFRDPLMREKAWFSDYLNKCFRISSGKEMPGLELKIDTVLLEDDAMTIGMHALVPSSPNSLYIYNTLLVDIYPDQSNLVIFVYKNRETGIKFDVKKHDAEVILR
ncbi:MAG: hypothetical protein P1P86_02995 [Bacteroidales bacterium]|nr:hypothetical protein [Bacteroidales bacterium]